MAFSPVYTLLSQIEEFIRKLESSGKRVEVNRRFRQVGKNLYLWGSVYYFPDSALFLTFEIYLAGARGGSPRHVILIRKSRSNITLELNLELGDGASLPFELVEETVKALMSEVEKILESS